MIPETIDQFQYIKILFILGSEAWGNKTNSLLSLKMISFVLLPLSLRAKYELLKLVC